MSAPQQGFAHDSPEITAWCASIIGEPLGDVVAAAKEGGASVRVVKRNGMAMICTRDFRRHRLNVEVSNKASDGVMRVIALGGWG